MPKKIQIFMDSNTAGQGFDEIVTIHLQLHEIIQMLSELNFSGLSVSRIAVLAGVIVVDHMSIEPFSVFPSVIAFLGDFETGKCVVEEFGGFKTRRIVDD